MSDLHGPGPGLRHGSPPPGVLSQVQTIIELNKTKTLRVAARKDSSIPNLLFFQITEYHKLLRLIERNERSDFSCLLKLWGTRLCLGSFVSQSGFRKLAANQSQVEGNRGKLSGT